MKKRFYLSLICASLLGASEVQLNSIMVESSTIDDLGYDPKTEISTVNVINEETIEKINPKNINDLLQTIPGITADVRSDVVEIHIRGINQQEFMWEDTGVAVIIDGVPVMQDGGKVRGINIDEIESIKVIKGSAGYLYGADASAGAIIITTKKHKNKNGVDISGEWGSYGYQNYEAKAYGTGENYDVSIYAGYKDEDGYWYQTSNDQKTASGKFTYYLTDNTDMTLGVDITKRYQETTRGGVVGVTQAQENPTGEDDGDLAWSRDYYSDIYKYYLSFNSDFGNLGNLLVNTYYYKDLYNYLASPQDLDGDRADDTYVRDSDDDIKQYGIKAEYRVNIKKLALMVGTDIGVRDYEEYDETIVDYSNYNYRTHQVEDYYAGEYTTEDSTDNRYAAYTEAKLSLSQDFTLVGNIRYDYNKYELDTLEHEYDGASWSDTKAYDSESFNNLTYRFGAAYTILQQHTLYANVSTGFRNPSLSQLADNTNLDKETYISYEIGTRGNISSKLFYEVSAFLTDTKDIISKVDGTYNWDSDFYDNVGDARNQGVEVALKGKPLQNFSFNIAYTYLDAYYRSHNPFIIQLDSHDETYNITGNQLPRVPHHKIDCIVNFKPIQALNLMAEFYAQSNYYADETNLVKMPGYGKVNLRVDYDPIKNLTLFAKVDNVTDNQYYRTVYLFKDANGDDKFDAEDATITVDPGRVFYAGVKYRF